MENNQSIENEQPQERSRESILAELRNQLRVDHDYLTKNDEILDCNLEELKERYKARNDIIEAYIENNKQIGNKENESKICSNYEPTAKKKSCGYCAKLTSRRNI